MAGLFATIYPSTPGNMRPTIRKQYESLSKDEMPMVSVSLQEGWEGGQTCQEEGGKLTEERGREQVRSAVFVHLPALAAVVEKEIFVSEITPMFNELSADLQESVREIAVDNMVRLSPESASAGRVLRAGPGAAGYRVQRKAHCSACRTGTALCGHSAMLRRALRNSTALAPYNTRYCTTLHSTRPCTVHSARAAVPSLPPQPQTLALRALPLCTQPPARRSPARSSFPLLFLALCFLFLSPTCLFPSSSCGARASLGVTERVRAQVKMVHGLGHDEAARFFGAFFDNVQTEKCRCMPDLLLANLPAAIYLPRPPEQYMAEHRAMS